MNLTKTKIINNKISIYQVLIFFLIPVTMYFLITKAFPKLIPTKENYGDYYWFRAPWLFVHVVCGIFATLIGPFQFIKRFRNNHLRLHKKIGKLYLICVLTASLSSIYLAFTSDVTIYYTVGLLIGGAAWLYSGILAYLYIRIRNIKSHRQWMTRNYVITFFFIIFFGMYDLFKAIGVGTYEQLLSILPLACLIIPLSITEFYLRKKTKKKK